MAKGICAHCGGKMEEKNVVIDRRVEDKLLIFENVPAEVCLICGSRWFSMEVLKNMDQKITEHLKPTRIESIPVFSLKESVMAGK